MKMKMLFVLPLFLFIAAFVSCNDDYDHATYYAGMGTVLKQGKDYAIDFDNSRTMTLADSSLLVATKSQTPGQRVIVSFTYDEGRLPNTIFPIDVVRVLTKPFFPIPTLEQSDSIGNDPIKLVEAWVGGAHLNVKYAYYTSAYGGRAHFINAIDLNRKDDKGYVSLEFRHNDNNDYRNRVAYGYVSFPLSEEYLRGNGFNIKYKDFNGREITLPAKLK